MHTDDEVMTVYALRDPKAPDAIAGDLWATHLPPGSGPSSDWVAFGRIDAGAAAWAR